MEIVLWLEIKLCLRDWKHCGPSFPNSFKGYQWDDKFCWGHFFIGWWESDEEWFWLFRRLLFSGGMNLWWEGGFPGGGWEEWANFWLVRGDSPPIPQVGKTLVSGFPDSRLYRDLKNIEIPCDLVSILVSGSTNMGKMEFTQFLRPNVFLGGLFKRKLWLFWKG